MTDTTLNLGDFQFAAFEIPEQIPFGGEQSLVVHKMVGGKRVVDSMGEDPVNPEWSGFFVGASALDRALYLDGLRKAGKPLVLTWSQLRYTIVIRSFHCTFVRAYRLPYSISCEVVSDDTAPITAITDPAPEQLIGDDLDSASGLVDGLDDDTLSGLMGALNGAVSTVGSLTMASPSALNMILLPLAAVRSRVSTMLDTSDITIGAGPLGGIVAGGILVQQVAGLSTQIAAVNQEPVLIDLDRTLGRVATNIGALNSGTKSVTLAGGNLFAIAADEYGDPMGWTAIAAANKLSDPSLTGIQTLQIPPFSNDTNGIPNA